MTSYPNLYHLTFTARFSLLSVASCLCMARIQFQALCNQVLTEKKKKIEDDCPPHAEDVDDTRVRELMLFEQLHDPIMKGP